MNVQERTAVILAPERNAGERPLSRKKELDVVSVVMAVMVVVIHISSEAVTKLPAPSLSHIAVFVPWRLFMCAVQGFILVSGIKFAAGFRRRELRYGAYLCSRLKKIILPYAVCNVLYYVYFVGDGYFPFKISALVRYIFNGELVAPFYFVLIIMQFYLLAPLWLRLLKKAPAAPLLAVSLIVTVLWDTALPEILRAAAPSMNLIPWSRVFFGNLIYWMVGCCIGARYEDAMRQLRADTRRLTLLTFLTAAIFLPYSYLLSVYGGGLRYGFVLRAVQNLLFMLLCLCGVPLLLRVCAGIAVKYETLCAGRVFSCVAASTYYIYLIHCLFIQLTDKLLARLDVTRIRDRFCIRLIAVCALSVVSASLLTAAEEKIRTQIKKNRKDRKCGKETKQDAGAEPDTERTHD